MKSARAANAAVACEFDDVLGGWMSPTAATCMTPPWGGVVVGGVVVGGVVVGGVVVVGGAVVVGGTVVVGAAVVVGCTGALTPPSITSWGGVLVSRLANRPASLWVSSRWMPPVNACNAVVSASVSLPPCLMVESWRRTSVTSTSTHWRALITGA